MFKSIHLKRNEKHLINIIIENINVSGDSVTQILKKNRGWNTSNGLLIETSSFKHGSFDANLHVLLCWTPIDLNRSSRSVYQKHLKDIIIWTRETLHLRKFHIWWKTFISKHSYPVAQCFFVHELRDFSWFSKNPLFSLYSVINNEKSDFYFLLLEKSLNSCTKNCYPVRW